MRNDPGNGSGQQSVLLIETVDGLASFALEGNEVSIGRGASNDLRLAVPTVSSHHALLRREADHWQLVDLHSSNGTTVNGARIEEAPLRDGQSFRLAEAVTITLHLAQAPATIDQIPAYDAPPPQPLAGTVAVSGAEADRAREALLAPQASPPGREESGASFFVQRPSFPREQAATGQAPASPPASAGPLGRPSSIPRPSRPQDPVPQPVPVQAQVPAAEEEPETAGVLLETLNLRKEVDKGKVILQNITLVVQPQEFVAVVGVSGAGKSTLLGALSGFRPATGGQVILNGISLYEHFDALRERIGYVPQDDIIHRELTVERALSYAAELRLPPHTSTEARAARVDTVIGELGLQQQRTTVVSSLSGGQRKRVSIGVELLTSPPLFFLDEPTSGLDPGTETRMMALLRQLADQGRTVLLITHATRNVSMCDRVLFLARGGRIAFYGGPRTALDYFGVGEFEDIYDLIENTRTPEEWEANFRNSPLYTSEITNRLVHPQGATATPAPHVHHAVQLTGEALRESEGLRQFTILTRRYAEIVLRDRKNLLILLLQAPILAILLFALFKPNIFERQNDVFILNPQTGRLVQITPRLLAQLKQLQQQQQRQAGPGQRTTKPPPLVFYAGAGCQEGLAPGVQAVQGCDQDSAAGNAHANKAAQLASILAIVAVWLGTLNAIREISKEDAIYRRERLVSLRVFPYIASKFAVLLALIVVQTFLLALIVGIRISFGGSGVFGVWLSLLLGGAASVAVALSVSAAVSNPDRAIFAAPLLMVPQIFFAGLFVQVKELGPAQPLAAIVTTRWTYEAVGRAAGVFDAAVVPPLFQYRDALDGGAWSRWLILFGFIAAFGGLAVFLQTLKDKR